jgi:polyphosphate kinase
LAYPKETTTLTKAIDMTDADTTPAKKDKKLTKKKFEKELQRLQLELVRLQEWVRHTGERVAVIFEGRDAAGKGGVIRRISDPLNPRFCRIAALDKPTERERTQWYFQRYAAHLPSAGEIVLFDRSWYNRGGVERVMGFCTDAEYDEFLHSCPQFEELITRSGIRLIKYWFSVSDEEQEKRFKGRIANPMKNWKLSPMDLEARNRWIEYSRAKDEMFKHTDLDFSPWWVVDGDNKRRARLNCISHLLGQFDYDEIAKPELDLTERRSATGYERPPMDAQRFVPHLW